MDQVSLLVLAGALLPPLIDWLSKSSVTSGVKSAVLPALSLLVGVVASATVAAQAGTTFEWKAALLNTATTWAIGWFAHGAVWKPSGISDVLQARVPPLTKSYRGRHAA